MIINYFEEYTNEDRYSIITPKSDLIYTTRDPHSTPKFRETFGTSFRRHNYKLPECFAQTTRFDGCTTLLKQQTISEEEVTPRYEYKRVGLFKKEPILCLDSHIEKHIETTPIVKGLEILGNVNSDGEIWYNSGYGRILLDEITGLPRLKRLPQTIDEVLDIIKVDPRYIEIINPSWDFINDDAVKTITRSVDSSFQDLIKCQDTWGVPKTEEELQNRKDYENFLFDKSSQFVSKYKELNNESTNQG